MRRYTLRAAIAGCLLLVVPAPAAPARAVGASAPSRSVEAARQILFETTVRIYVEGGAQQGLCTGWVGWSEESRSALYTAAHCRREAARYRVQLPDGGSVYATHYTRWDALDLMALWVPRGRLRVLRAWKPLPEGPFHAAYVLSERGSAPRFVDVPIPRVFWELRFENHPTAIALPLYSAPGTSGAPVVDAADGVLVGMIVGYATDRPEVAAVVPAQTIYDALAAAGPSR
ncbi:MAG TPA: trypsin-like peptidase domain-containing protein [bacterium]|nr:trypsin-like peptidase domain-containing protein [bacterium]